MIARRSTKNIFIDVLASIVLVAPHAFGFTIDFLSTSPDPLFSASTTSPAKSVLSVGIVSFTGSVNNGVVVLKWQTATETNCYGFDIERKTSDTPLITGTWAKVGFVAGNGTSNVTQNYQYQDSPVTSNNYTYRLKQINTEGQFGYGNELTVAVSIVVPAPSGTLAASTATVPSTGGSVTLTWTSANASTASLDQGIGLVALNGSVSVAVTTTKTFTLTVTNSVGVTAKFAVTITAPTTAVYQTVISAFIAGPGLKNNSVLLGWTTSSEINNSSFDIERKKGTGVYAKIANVGGIGNSTTPTQYQYTDANLKNGTYFYRLRQINTNGTSTYSAEVSIQVSHNVVTVLSSYPNPFNPSTNIYFTAEQSGHATLKIYNVIGQIVATLFNGEIEAGIEHTELFNAASLSTGLYFSVLDIAGQRFVLKVLYSK
jgi:Secretion system C-terminal sorting domain